MKKNIYLQLLLIALTSCTGIKSKYEETIRKCVETDKYESRYDLKIQILELIEQGNITVADSITILTDQYRKDQEVIIKRIELAKKMAEKQMNRKNIKQAEIEKYKKTIIICNHRIDSLRNLVPSDLKGYDKRNSDDILVLIIRCKYSIQPPIVNTTVEEIFDFFLSPSGDICYGKTRSDIE